METSSINHTKALEYVITKGYSVIPVGKNKRPLIEWREYQKRLPTEEEINHWWSKNPQAGVGIITGEVSGLTVVDIDTKDSIHMKRGDFPTTYTVRTPSGGWHLYYEYDGGVVKNTARAWDHLPGVDIRNDGGYVVAPPSDGYEVMKEGGGDLGQFPAKVFAGGNAHQVSKKLGKSFSLSESVGVGSGGRNDTITRVIGSLLSGVPENKWEKEVWPTVVKINQTYIPPLSERELLRTFESVATKEKQKQEEATKNVMGAVRSPVQFSDAEVAELRLRTSKNGVVIKDKLNAMIALANHPEWRDAFKYDEFSQEIYCRGEKMKNHHYLEAQTWLQGEMELHGIPKNIVIDAVDERAMVCKFNSAVSWLKSLEWDGESRVDTWLPTVYGVEDSEYYRSIGSNWLRYLVKRLVYPGTKFDHVLVIQGGQGVRKTTSFAVLGGPWHLETVVHAESKDFLMQFQGKAVIELAEGDTLRRAETRALKAIISRTHDKYRAPYARLDEEHPRQCVFCMTTNDLEFLKDETGNRRWWILEMPRGVQANVEWLEENRDQLFAEAFARLKEGWMEVPEDVAKEMQEGARVVDVIEGKVMDWYLGMDLSQRDQGVTVEDYWEYMHMNSDNGAPPMIPWTVEQNIKNVFKGALKLSYARRRVGSDGSRVRKWFPTDDSPPPEDF